MIINILETGSLEDRILKAKEEDKEMFEAIKYKSDEEKIEEIWDSIQTRIALLEYYTNGASEFLDTERLHFRKMNKYNKSGRVVIKDTFIL